MLSLRRPPLPHLHPVVWISTWFWVGLIRPMSGTWGSLAALPFAWVIAAYGGAAALTAAAAAVFALGVWSSNRYERADGGKDPGAIVIDEVAGQWLTLAPFAPDPVSYLLGFALFRLFDILKPWPIRLLERKFTGGLGVMLDDIGAGLAAMACLFLLQPLI